MDVSEIKDFIVSVQRSASMRTGSLPAPYRRVQCKARAWHGAHEQTHA